MQVINHLEQFKKPDFSVVTIGTFDGVHIGHQTILKQIVSEAKENNGKSILITFWPHPRFVLNKNADLKLLSTFEEKSAIIKELGVDYIVKLEFTAEFSKLSAHDFVESILIDAIGTKNLFIGYDHHFGNNREGNISFLKENASEFGFEVNEISRQDIDDIGVSSTKIRNAIGDGQIHLANSLLGRNYSLSGEVIHGEKKGREIGFPTANILVPETYKLLPADGAYAIKATVRGEKYNGMLNIGFKPTLKGTKRTIEAHLFNFDEQIYEEMVKIEFIKLLRRETKFNSLDELKNQLNIDRQEAMNLLS